MDEPFGAVQFTLQHCPFRLDRIVQDQFEQFHITVRYVSTELRKLEGRNARSHDWRNENRVSLVVLALLVGVRRSPEHFIDLW